MRLAITTLLLLMTSWASAQDSLAYMQADPFGLEQIVVTATRTPKRLKDVPVLTQVISGRQIQERGVDNIRDLLMQEVPGLNFQEVAFGTEVDMQGLGAKHVLILVDGERIAGETNGNIDYSRINVFNIERVEIVKGAASALYGSSAMGGVINIITRRAQQKVEASAGLKFSGRNQKNFSAHPHVYEKHLDQPNLNGNISLGVRLDKLTANTDILYSSKDAYQLFDRRPVRKYFPAYQAAVVDELNAALTCIDGLQDLNIQQKLALSISPKLRLSAHGGYYRMNKYDFSSDYLYKRTEDFSFGGAMDWKPSADIAVTAAIHADLYSRYDRMEKLNDQMLDYRNNTLQPRLSLVWTGAAGQNLTAGLEYFRETLYTDQFGTLELKGNAPSTYSTKAQGYATIYAQDEWTLSPKVSLTMGLRYDRHEAYGGNLSPKLGAMWRINPLTLRANIAWGYRSPTLKELWMNWDHLGMFWIYGNPALKPEKNRYYSLSAEYTGRRLNCSANIYLNDFTDKIEGVWSNNQTELRYLNIGSRRLAGLELMAKLIISPCLSLHGSYAYLYSQPTNEVQLSASAPHSGVLRLEYRTHRPLWQTTVNLTTTTCGSKRYDVQGRYEDEVTGFIDTEAYYKVRVEAYCVIDLTLAQQLGRQWSVSCGLTNLLDYQPAYYNFNTLINPGRKAFIALNYKL